MKVRKLNHAVLRVRDVDRSLEFYTSVLGFETVARIGHVMALLRAPGSENHHDLGLARVGPNAPPPNERGVGLYHLAWESMRSNRCAKLATPCSSAERSAARATTARRSQFTRTIPTATSSK
ncbi:MAG TPA: VOC family protein [Candidatus Cybelea sp.]